MNQVGYHPLLLKDNNLATNSHEGAYLLGLTMNSSTKQIINYQSYKLIF